MAKTGRATLMSGLEVKHMKLSRTFSLWPDIKILTYMENRRGRTFIFQRRIKFKSLRESSVFHGVQQMFLPLIYWALYVNTNQNEMSLFF